MSLFGNTSNNLFGGSFTGSFGNTSTEKSETKSLFGSNVSIFAPGKEKPAEVNSGLFSSILPLLEPKSNQQENAMLSSVYQKMLYPDVIFLVEEKEFQAHKGILASRCKFFENMFASGMKESQEKHIKFDDMSKDAFSSLLRFIYCAELNLTVDSALELLKVADKYAVPELLKSSEEFIIQRLSVENYAKVVKAAEAIENTKVKNAALSFMGKNIKALAKRNDIFDISKEILVELLSRAQVFDHSEPNEESLAKNKESNRKRAY